MEEKTLKNNEEKIMANLAKELLGICSKSRKTMLAIIEESKESIAGGKDREKTIQVIREKFEDEANKNATEEAKRCVMDTLEISQSQLYKLIAIQIIEEDNELFDLLQAKSR